MAEGSGPASSPASSAGGRFLVAAGPAFNAEGRPQGDPIELDDDEPDPNADVRWEEEQVRVILSAKGAVLHGVIGVAEQDWKYTQADLDAIAPALTRILNRHDTTRVAAAAGDEFAAAIGFGGWALRSTRERQRELKARREAEPAPLTGAPADYDPAADPGADWQPFDPETQNAGYQPPQPRLPSRR